MASLVKVKDLYDDIAVITGFPKYTNATDTPDINRFILEMINEGVSSLIDVLNTNNNALQKEDRIVTTPGKYMYAFEGIVKHIEITDDKGRIHRVTYKDNDDFYATPQTDARRGLPRQYVISNGYIKLLPTPDKVYNIKVITSTNDIVLSDSDVRRSSVSHINDSLMCTQDLANLVKLRTCALIFMRCNSPLTQVYAELANARMKTYTEMDYGSNEAQRGYDRSAGHYDSNRGLLG